MKHTASPGRNVKELDKMAWKVMEKTSNAKNTPRCSAEGRIFNSTGIGQIDDSRIQPKSV